MATVLVVEDEPRIAGVVKDYLVQAGYDVLLAAHGGAALTVMACDAPDLVVLDLGLPDLDGLDVMRKIRETSGVPIVILTARSDETDKVVGLELGADDYVVKPFGPKELIARIRALLRRIDTEANENQAEVKIGQVVIDPKKMTVERSGLEVAFTATEFRIIEVLTSQPGRVFTRGQLLDAVHGVSFESYERAIDAHIKNIRRKLEPEVGSPRYVLTVHGVGYKFADA
ncbi:MAG: response regulator transcription factor [Acidimicrobiales bacterium]|nr:response regulator transcription factor [Acidimicrobiales bacterium]